LHDPGLGPEAAAVRADDGERVKRAVGSLGDEYRATILLRFYQGLSLQEVADALHVPLGTVKSRLSVGVRRLRDLLMVANQEARPRA
jgi:RNA polymerase sigma-70 factor, ECF subfamily